MARLKVHGGDFAPSGVWFYPARGRSVGFIVRTHDNRQQRILVEDLGAAEPATADWIRTLSGDETMVDALEQLSVDDRAGAFVALFTDGRILLASTDPETRPRLLRAVMMHTMTNGGERHEDGTADARNEG